jgi:hypothetical protein
LKELSLDAPQEQLLARWIKSEINFVKS